MLKRKSGETLPAEQGFVHNGFFKIAIIEPRLPQVVAEKYADFKMTTDKIGLRQIGFEKGRFFAFRLRKNGGTQVRLAECAAIDGCLRKKRFCQLAFNNGAFPERRMRKAACVKLTAGKQATQQVCVFKNGAVKAAVSENDVIQARSAKVGSAEIYLVENTTRQLCIFKGETGKIFFLYRLVTIEAVKELLAG
nr:hypothetical protein [Advenella kashmirensis]